MCIAFIPHYDKNPYGIQQKAKIQFLPHLYEFIQTLLTSNSIQNHFRSQPFSEQT